MDLTRLNHILAVARTQSFSRAAEQVRITQPALSRSIAAFEQRHGVILFDRGRGGAYPTPAGKLVIEQAQRLLAAAHELERSLLLYGAGEAGRVVMGIGPLLASLLLSELAQVMLADRPGLQLVSITRTPEYLLPELLNDRVEFIVGNSWQVNQAPGTEFEVIHAMELGITVRSGHPLTQLDTVTAADLARYPTASAIELAPPNFSSAHGAFVCDNFHIMRETVLKSDCVWLSSATFIAREIGEGSLVLLDVEGMAPVVSDICIVWRQNRSRSPAALAVIERIKAILSQVERSA